MNELALKKTLEKFCINFDQFMEVYNSFIYEPFSAEEFLFTDISFLSQAMPKKLLRYIKESGLSIDTTHLEKCIADDKRNSQIEDMLTEIYITADCCTDDDYKSELEEEITTLLVEQESLLPYEDIYNECLKLKQIICEQS